MYCLYHSNIPEPTTAATRPLNMAPACEALLGVGRVLPEGVVSELVAEGEASEAVFEAGAPEVPVEEDLVATSVVVGDAVAVAGVTVRVPVVEGARVISVTVDSVVRLTPQTSFRSNVNSIFLVSHAKVCRWMESACRQK